ncbi:Carotenoid oxygenase [Shewanella baltica OS183]|uniref:carotenoid oxygenase family protein n=1 Tax=Shewanella baltica TaxID=62322 RepID=UPI0001E10D80|nr:carotenoid oxygenase family protein [Shewanella baltica]AEG12278.1 Carotenoid oxygenase [Shewanella baltica BA175]EHQ14183.1 Carotenoid oxygenase [Shewanella baltica OS183]
MDRRQFLAGSAALMTTAVWASSVDKLLALDNAQAVAREPWAIGFSGAEGDYQPLTMQVSGEWPAQLSGNLYRNGPAKMSRAGKAYQHWFDGDGMVQQFSMANGQIQHQAKFIQTKKFKVEEAAGVFKYTTAGTVIPNALPIRNNDDLNVANTSLLPRHGELLALWEAGSPYRLDAQTLTTLGVKSFGDKFKGLPFSAHPLDDGQGGLWNFGVWYVGGEKLLLVYQVAADDSIARMEVIELPQASYLHAFAQSENKLVFYISSCVYEEGETYIDAFKWRPELPSQLLVIDKADFKARQLHPLPAGFVFHFGQAIEKNDELSVQLCLYPNSAILTQGMKGLLTGVRKTKTPHAELVTITVPLTATLTTTSKTQFAGTLSSSARINRSGVMMEFPQFAQHTMSNKESAQQTSNAEKLAEKTGGASEFVPLFGVGARSDSATNSNFKYEAESESESGLSNTLYCIHNAKHSSQNGVDTLGDASYSAFYLGKGKIAEEPLYIPATEQHEAYLLMTWLDYHNAQSGLSLFRASDISAGPIASAQMNRVLPLGFHGCFINA